MLRATVALRRLQLIGCDTMHNAEKLRLFPSFDESPHCTIDVSLVPTVTKPIGDRIGENGNADILRLADGRHALCHRGGWYTVAYNDDFSDVSVTLCRDIEKAPELHYLLVSQCFSYHLLTARGCSLHSAGVLIGNGGIALCGRSGIGKSTLAKHLQALDRTVTVLCEDMPALTVREGWQLHGTPFCGQDEGCANGEVPLKAVVLLSWGQENRLEPVAPTKALHALLSCMPLPKYCEALHRVGVDRAIRLVGDVPILQFVNDGTPEAASVLMRELMGLGIIN